MTTAPLPVPAWPHAGPPPSEDALLERARAFAGARVTELARATGRVVDEDGLGKGTVGELVERALGLARSNAPRPDVEALGIEVKTLPIDAEFRVTEGTYVGRLHVDEVLAHDWTASRVRAKLARVLFVLVEPAHVPLAHRRVGQAFLWSPDDVEETVLALDYADLRDLVGRGLMDLVSARRGRALQLRPKGRNARETGVGVDEDGAPITVAPRGFYLRPTFTASLVRRALLGA